MVESDAQLVHRVLEGEIAAFETLMRRYERSVRSVAMAFLSDLHASEDVVQETFVAAFRSLASLQHGNKFAPWLMQIAPDRGQVGSNTRASAGGNPLGRMVAAAAARGRPAAATDSGGDRAIARAGTIGYHHAFF